MNRLEEKWSELVYLAGARNTNQAERISLPEPALKRTETRSRPSLMCIPGKGSTKVSPCWWQADPRGFSRWIQSTGITAENIPQANEERISSPRVKREMRTIPPCWQPEEPQAGQLKPPEACSSPTHPSPCTGQRTGMSPGGSTSCFREGWNRQPLLLSLRNLLMLTYMISQGNQN